MKIRLGFVANSSSTSYVCNVCKEIMTLNDGDDASEVMLFCENGHEICREHVEYKHKIQEVLDEEENLKEEFCPICSFEVLDTDDIRKYLMKKNKYTEKSLTKEIKTIFNTYEKFKEYIENETNIY
jgi:DNA-directed RNA polymerase subunit RPC12/RpoP